MTDTLKEPQNVKLGIGQDTPTQAPPEGEKVRDFPPGAPEALQDAAEGNLPNDEEGAEQEIAVLDFLCGDQEPLPFTVEAKIDTPKGRGTMVFHMRQLDASRIEGLEKKHTSKEDGLLDRQSLNADLLAHSCRYMTDASGQKIDPESPEFVRHSIAARYAFLRAFSLQPGILGLVADEIRKMAAMDMGRVSEAERVMSDAVGK